MDLGIMEYSFVLPLNLSHISIEARSDFVNISLFPLNHFNFKLQRKPSCFPSLISKYTMKTLLFPLPKSPVPAG